MLIAISFDVIENFADDPGNVSIGPIEDLVEKQIKKQIETEEKMLSINKSLL